MQDSAQSPANIAREIKSLSQALTGLFQAHEPWHKDVDFQRCNLRALYLKLLLVHPFSKESRDVETALWMQTSYQFISSYKQRIAALDRKLFGTQRPQNNHNHPGQNNHVEYRRILQRFRQYLAAEEKFWIRLLVKFQRRFDLPEVVPALAALEIIGEAQPERNEGGGRNIFPEESEPQPTPASQRGGRLAICSKLLVCIGDIARYREQYNDGGGRPRAGHEELATNKKANWRGGRRGGAPSAQNGDVNGNHNVAARARNYSKARTSYEQARLLVPEDGNASHQLAIIASYRKDLFESLLHYYRAMCVRQPYDTASENMNTILKKALDRWNILKKDDTSVGTPVERFKEDVASLHALWSFDPDESFLNASDQAQIVATQFTFLISHRSLLGDVISDVVITALSALWKLRMIRDPSKKRSGGGSNPKKRDVIVEPMMIRHILDLFKALLDVGDAQLQFSPADVQDESDLAQKITAELRRMLPAMRIMLKWVRSNISYIETAPAAEQLTDAITDFWTSFSLFFTSLASSFPPSRLSQLNGPLDEDVEMSGFSPIKVNLFKSRAATGDGLLVDQSEVHPNEEQLMRISDLLEDATALTKLENSPLAHSDGKFSVRFEASASADQSMALPSPPADSLANIMFSHPDPPRAPRDSDDDNATQTSRTDDDPVRDAFNVALSPIDDDDDDEIVWDPRVTLSPEQRTIQPPAHSSPVMLPNQATFSSGSLQVQEPPTPSTTAQDLLNSVLRMPPILETARYAETPAAPPLIFGPGSPSVHSKSIWAMTDTPQSTYNSSPSTYMTPSLPQSFIPSSPRQLAIGHGRSTSMSQSPWSMSPIAFAQRPLMGSPPTSNFTPRASLGSLNTHGVSAHAQRSPTSPTGMGSHMYHPSSQLLGPLYSHQGLVFNEDDMNMGYTGSPHGARIAPPSSNFLPVQRAWGDT